MYFLRLKPLKQKIENKFLVTFFCIWVLEMVSLACIGFYKVWMLNLYKTHECDFFWYLKVLEFDSWSIFLYSWNKVTQVRRRLKFDKVFKDVMCLTNYDTEMQSDPKVPIKLKKLALSCCVAKCLLHRRRYHLLLVWLTLCRCMNSN